MRRPGEERAGGERLELAGVGLAALVVGGWFIVVAIFDCAFPPLRRFDSGRRLWLSEPDQGSEVQ